MTPGSGKGRTTPIVQPRSDVVHFAPETMADERFQVSRVRRIGSPIRRDGGDNEPVVHERPQSAQQDLLDFRLLQDEAGCAAISDDGLFANCARDDAVDQVHRALVGRKRK